MSARTGVDHKRATEPDATTGKPFAQITLYALAPSHLTGIPLFDFKCAWFNERQYCEFFPRPRPQEHPLSAAACAGPRPGARTRAPRRAARNVEAFGYRCWGKNACLVSISGRKDDSACMGIDQHPLRPGRFSERRTRLRHLGRRPALHVYVIGKTGTGKSTLLENMALQDLERGNGFALIDPHGDLVGRIAARFL